MLVFDAYGQIIIKCLKGLEIKTTKGRQTREFNFIDNIDTYKLQNIKIELINSDYTTNFMINESSINVDEIVEDKLNEGLSTMDMNYEVMSSQKVGPTIADDIKDSAIWI